ncbi:MAG: SH3 domain-containing protein [Lentihominibacter sp.]
MKAAVKCELNFRSEPKKGDNVIRILPKGHRVTIIEVADKWMKVKASRKTGYVRTEYVDIIPEEIKEPEAEAAGEPAEETEAGEGDE